ncbi:MAG: class I SAM-dependent methyltransferase [Acidimicrobiales bacterium]
MARERRDVFGEAVEQYAKARPGYPDAMVEDILAYADPANEILEVGAGTGKATVSFASRGVTMTCLEPDPRMAARLKEECAPFPDVTIEVTRLEDYSRPLAFDALIAGQSWHWVDRLHRWDLAYEAVREGGTIALFWNAYVVADDATRAELRAIDERYSVDAGHYGVTGQDDPTGDEIELEEGWPAYDLVTDSRFEDLVSRRYRRHLNYDTETFIDLLASTSSYRLLEESDRKLIFHEVRDVVSRHGEPVAMTIVTDLFLGHTTSPTSDPSEIE